ncbi:adenylosuccinate lyase [Cladophialophora bantiana CBS 173.52]|uniref:Adenylosuccinate lyase n=1 Tax=Cladophialophora bantiana (strain ATCC 10958 / CBS 173.52 / CDC B-1940 / NIH 8579) TaxID=1442370 RepID=A0A0D2IGW2_CLAB1|nr:adenylosuccinate lyase [Cladophialophora bantiana CBS 173.52]KIW95979.1 adenylosuccinate lyase [Cladophialophora bantiana CBS 173.52]
MAHDTWQSPLAARYASGEMLTLFSARTRATTWRQLWIWLAEAEKELGLDIPDEAIAQMEAAKIMTDDDFQVAAVEEKRRRHDVMAHVHAFGQRAPAAAGKIHLGATSCYVTDNADLIFLRDGLSILLPKIAKCVKKLSDFALQHKALPCLGFTHGQPAQPITVGRRATQWIESLLMDLRNFERARADLVFRGVKGTTGTQASFLELFHGDHAKVKQLDQLVTQKAGFSKRSIVSVQTYNRKIDFDIANVLASFGTTCEHIGTDLRHLAMLKEVEEPFEKDQIGSSAMAYKRNPMRSERMCSLARKLVSLASGFGQTYAHQWFERSLDDSAIRRVDIPEMFLITDALCILLENVSSGLVVYPQVISARLQQELPFMATETMIMRMAEKGASRQETHEQIRVLSHQAAAVVKLQGQANDLVDRIKNEKFFEPIWNELTPEDLLNPSKFVGRSAEQVDEFVEEAVVPALEPYKDQILSSAAADIHV